LGRVLPLVRITVWLWRLKPETVPLRRLSIKLLLLLLLEKAWLLLVLLRLLLRDV
jgi:hypothetical protein